MKTLEQTIREKLATGYDPVQLAVSARGINEENIEVSIEGVKYSIKGNSVSEVHGHRAAAAPAAPVGEAVTDTQPAAADAGGEGSGEAGAGTGGVIDPQAPDENMDAELTKRMDAVVAGYAGKELQPVTTGEDGVTVFNVVDEAGEIIGTGTLVELEGFLAQNTTEQPEDQEQNSAG